MRKRILISIGLIFSIHLIASEESYAYETLAEDLSHPWGLAVIDEKNIIFTELLLKDLTRMSSHLQVE